MNGGQWKKFCGWLGVGAMFVAWGVLPVYATPQKLTFGTQVRFRGESQNNFNAKYYGSHPPKGDEPDNFLLGRFRLGFDYRPDRVTHLAFWGQDAREWGSGFHNKDFYNRIFRWHVKIFIQHFVLPFL